MSAQPGCLGPIPMPEPVPVVEGHEVYATSYCDAPWAAVCRDCGFDAETDEPVAWLQLGLETPQPSFLRWLSDVHREEVRWRS